VEVLLSAAPKVSRVAVLVNPRNSSNAANAINLQIALQGDVRIGLPVEASTAEVGGGFIKMKEQNADAVVVAPDAVFVEQRQRIADLAIKHRSRRCFPFANMSRRGA
jgi:hypothetical protein